jgi:hypothetical protein
VLLFLEDIYGNMQLGIIIGGSAVFVEIKFREERRETKYKKGQTGRPLSTFHTQIEVTSVLSTVYQQLLGRIVWKEKISLTIVYLFESTRLYLLVSAASWCETYLQSVVIVWGRP